MASNNERVGKALELLNAGLRPFVEREMRAVHKEGWQQEAATSLRESRTLPGRDGAPHFDTHALLAILQWNPVFRNVLGHAERSWMSELRETRNRWAHQGTFNVDDTHRALDNIRRLLAAVSAPEAAEANQLWQDFVPILAEEHAPRKRHEPAASVLPVSKLRLDREVDTTSNIQETWDSIRGLEGRTLMTTSQHRPFDVVRVTDGVVFVEPHSTRRQRRVARADFEEVIGVRSSGERLRPSDVQLANASTRNSVYVVAILYALEEPIV